jgi:hypothetical protein
MRALRLLIVGALLAVAVLPATASAQPSRIRVLIDELREVWRLTAPVREAKDEAESQLETLEQMTNTLNAVVGGRRPDARYESWQELADAYAEARRNLEREPLPTTFDASAYTVSFDEFRNCATREAARQDLQAYQGALQAALGRGREQRDLLTGARAKLDSALVALDALIRIAGQHSANPVLGQYFLWNWHDMELGVRPQLQGLRAAVNARVARLGQEIPKLETYSSNLRSNLQGLASLACTPEGRWTGTLSFDGEVARVTVSFARSSGDFFTGSISVRVDDETFTGTISRCAASAGQPLNCRVTIEGEGARMRLTPSPDYTQFTGTLTPDGESQSASLSLRRQ